MIRFFNFNKKVLSDLNPLHRGSENHLKPYKTKMAILRLRNTKVRRCEVLWKGEYLDFQVKVVLHVHHTFLSSAGGPNFGKQHFSVKKAYKIRFCAVISHPIDVTLQFQMLLNILEYTLSVFEVIL